MSFLKEQQWRTEFATAPVREGTLAESVSGPAQIKPAGGGEVVLTAAVDATVASSPWPHTGLDVGAGIPVFRLTPRVGDRSLPELRADASSLEAEVDVARRRVERLTELLKVEATSEAEVERARAALRSLEARLAAARGGVAAASTAANPDGRERPSRFALPGRAAWPRSPSPRDRPSRRVPSSGAWCRCAPSGSWSRCGPRTRLASRPRSRARAPAPRSGGAPRGPRPRAAARLARARGDPRTASVSVILQVDRSTPSCRSAAPSRPRSSCPARGGGSWCRWPRSSTTRA